MKPVLSVIVPVYNQEQYISKCIKSILRIKAVEMELIIVDDGSTDGTASICKKYAEIDTRIRVISKENNGLLLSREIGYHASTSPFVAFVDSDDWIESDVAEKAIFYMLDNDDIDIVVMGYDDINENGTHINFLKGGGAGKYSF